MSLRTDESKFTAKSQAGKPGRHPEIDAIIAPSKPVAQPIPEASAELNRQFRELAKCWSKETSHLGVVARMAQHPAYLRIIALGPAVVPLLLDELRRKPDHWFAALSEITGANPVPPESEGRLGDMARAWVDWGKAQGYLA